jgi:hypothetical protein|tara:strand:+ start:647 stop:1117 length:471 start_codon:yes stop_codon:yes gene_type:complete
LIRGFTCEDQILARPAGSSLQINAKALHSMQLQRERWEWECIVRYFTSLRRAPDAQHRIPRVLVLVDKRRAGNSGNAPVHVFEDFEKGGILYVERVVVDSARRTRTRTKRWIVFYLYADILEVYLYAVRISRLGRCCEILQQRLCIGDVLLRHGDD